MFVLRVNMETLGVGVAPIDRPTELAKRFLRRLFCQSVTQNFGTCCQNQGWLQQHVGLEKVLCAIENELNYCRALPFMNL
jgi:hypothetical protein